MPFWSARAAARPDRPGHENPLLFHSSVRSRKQTLRMTLRRANIVITAVCALAGAGMLGGRVWAEGPAPLDLGPDIVVYPSSAPMPEATARSAPPSPMAPSLPNQRTPLPSKSPQTSKTSSPSSLPTTPSPSPSHQSGGRPVDILEPPRSTESGTPTPRPGGQEEEGDDDEEDSEDGGGGGSGVDGHDGTEGDD